MPHGPLEDCLRTVHGLDCAALVRKGVHALLELTGFVQLCIHRLALGDAQVAGTAGAAALQYHGLKTLGPLLGAVVDAFGEVPQPSFLQEVSFAVWQPTLEDIPDLIEVVPVARSAPTATTGEARVQVEIVR